jgi:CRISPR-associated endoribonuclease Cas6
MRLHFTLSPSTQPVPFNYQHHLTGVFHKWLGHNNLHNKISLYSLGWLDGARAQKNFLTFPEGAKWFVSFYQDSLFEELVEGVLAKPDVFCGMRIMEIRQQQTPAFGNRYRFKVGSPVWVKGKVDENKKVKYYFHHELEADAFLTATLRHKMHVAGLADDSQSVKVSFDRTFQNARVKKVSIKDVDVKGSVCPVIVEGTIEAVQFAWNVGVGNGTGSGFGSLKE